jgi:hypothetical protein
MRKNFSDAYKQFYCYLVEIVEAGFQLIIIYYTVRLAIVYEQYRK